MKKVTLIFAILFIAGMNSNQAQGTWIQKADFGGSARYGAVGFSIGSQGFIGTGLDELFVNQNDFWKYDPATDSWTQKTDFAGTGRRYAVGFSIGNNGYLGTGTGHSSTNDVWKYNKSSDTWSSISMVGSQERHGATTFSIGGKAYLGTGYQFVFNWKSDFWELDTATNVWTQKASFGGEGREGAVGFSIGNKGYIGTGVANEGYQPPYKDFWEYDPSTNTWVEKANFGGDARAYGVGFSIGTKGYIGTGHNGETLFKDFWEYDPATNQWAPVMDFASARTGAVGFSIGNKGYIGTGYDVSYKNDFWEYTPAVSSCTVPTNLSASNITSSSAMLTWDTVGGALKYKIRYKITGSSTWNKITNISSASKTIWGLSDSTSYTCQVKTVCSANPIVSSDWSSSQTFTTLSERIGDETPQQVSFQIYPNPTEDQATIQFTLTQSSYVFIKVYDISGKEIETLLNENVGEGIHSLPISTNLLSQGVYTVRISDGNTTTNQKLIVQ